MSVSAFAVVCLAVASPLSAGAPLAAAEQVDAAPAVGQQEILAQLADQDAGGAKNEIVVTADPSARHDPLRAVNAESFAVTRAADVAFVPLALGYKHAVPSPVRDGLRNFLANLHEPAVALNFLLQLKPGKAGETLGRTFINTTLGVGGLFDIAKRRPFNLPRRANGFADTLGYYGVGPGPFFYVPLLGPTTLRDLAGGFADRLVLPLGVGKPFSSPTYTIPAGVIGALDHRAESDERLHALRDGKDDAYIAARDAYFARRKAEIDHLRGKDREPQAAN